MISAAFRTLGKLALLAASAALLTAISLMVAGSFLMTFPLLRVSPKQRKLQASIELAAAGMALLTTLARDKQNEG